MRTERNAERRNQGKGGSKQVVDARMLVAAGFKHEGGCLWSRDCIFYGKEAALQMTWAESGRGVPRKAG